ncbi:hypothetical protein [Wansuia hejianensis]|uniref:Uncharacterized protein n=1 Tax=Wansuia hejianensis TaxID=2763667 RepID=A0A926EZN9_9FIRM|nr:hypothetical protein [Wansuia hejianensis]MBC8590631.1 hypothetical protein [Wansuia hejianensis]
MDNKDKLKNKINEFINVVVDKAAEDNKLDHFNIEISNHNGNLQMDYRLRDRKKVY